MSAVEKIEYISNVLYTGSVYSVIGTYYILPVISAAAFILLFPFPARWAYSYTRGKQKELKEIRQKIEDEEPLTQAEAKTLRRQHIELELAYEESLSKLRAENNRIKAVVAELSDRDVANKEATSEDDPVSESYSGDKIDGTKINPEMMGILKSIADAGTISKDEIVDFYDGGVASANFYLGELKKLNFINDAIGNLSATHNGLSLLKKLGKI